MEGSSNTITNLDVDLRHLTHSLSLFDIGGRRSAVTYMMAMLTFLGGRAGRIGLPSGCSMVTTETPRAFGLEEGWCIIEGDLIKITAGVRERRLVHIFLGGIEKKSRTPIHFRFTHELLSNTDRGFSL